MHQVLPIILIHSKYLKYKVQCSLSENTTQNIMLISTVKLQETTALPESLYLGEGTGKHDVLSL